MDQINCIVAEAVRDARKAAGVTLAQLSEQTGIPATTLKRRLNGRASFAMDELVRISIALGTTLGALIPEAALTQTGDPAA